MPAAATPIDMVFVLDESGSLDNSEFAAQRGFFQEILDQSLPPAPLVFGPSDDAAAVVAFGTTARTIQNMTFIRANVVNSIANIAQQQGSSCAACGLDLAGSLLAASGRTFAEDVVILLLDGSNLGDLAASAAALKTTARLLVIAVEEASLGDPFASLASSPADYFAADSFGDQFDFTVDLPEIIDDVRLRLVEIQQAETGVVAEPATLAIVGIGIAGLVLTRRRKKV